MSALTLHQLLLTAFFEIGLGSLALFIAFVIPNKKKSFFPYKCLEACALVVVFTLAGDLLTSVGLTSNLRYDFLYATANGAPNGAHVSSYLCVAFLVLFCYVKTKDIFFGLLSGALLVAFHELIWLLFYYSSYFEYLEFPKMVTNFVKDFPIFTTMLFMFVIAFKVYGKMKLSSFSLFPVGAFFLYCALWYFVPVFYLHYSHFLPIRTANLPSPTPVTSTIYNETVWFWDPLTNLFEVFSWILVTLLMVYVIIKERVV
jgi:hypothetical protein